MPLKSARSSVAFHIVVVAALAVLGLGVTEHIIKLERRNAREHLRTDTIEHLSAIRVAIEQELNITLNVTRALIAFVATHPELDADTFHALADELSVESRHIRNVGLAPDNVIQFVHPLEGNEAALGLRYEDVPEQWPAVQRTIESGTMYLDGPIELVQGGMALVARTPIFAMDPKTDRRERFYWGISSIVIDHLSLITAAMDGCGCGHIDFALSAENDGESSAVFYGEPDIFDDEGITLQIAVPGSSWQIRTRESRIDPGASRFLLVRAIGSGLTVLISLLVSMLISARTLNRRLALMDSLTGVPNRRYAFRRLHALLARHRRTSEPFGVIVIDVDSFKTLNDEHGHGFGDDVLIECARRLSVGSGGAADVARLGGDEFLVILPHAQSPEELKGVAQTLESHFSQPIISPSGTAVTISISAGSAMFGGDVWDIKQLLQAADSKMYERKRRGPESSPR